MSSRSRSVLASQSKKVELSFQTAAQSDIGRQGQVVDASAQLTCGEVPERWSDKKRHHLDTADRFPERDVASH